MFITPERAPPYMAERPPRMICICLIFVIGSASHSSARPCMISPILSTTFPLMAMTVRSWLSPRIPTWIPEFCPLDTTMPGTFSKISAAVWSWPASIFSSMLIEAWGSSFFILCPTTMNSSISKKRGSAPCAHPPLKADKILNASKVFFNVKSSL